MDTIIEKLGIYELFTVLGAGIISNVLWFFASGGEYKIISLNKFKGVDIFIGLIICYICGLILQELSSFLDNKIFKFRKNARKNILENNKIIKNKTELRLYRKLAKKSLNKKNLHFSDEDNETFYFIAKTYLERHSDNLKISRINSIYGMSRSVSLASIIAITFTVVSYILFNPKFILIGESICSVIVYSILEIMISVLFAYRAERFAKYKARAIMRYYYDEMKVK